MNPCFLVTVLVTLLPLAAGKLAAAEGFELRTTIYVYRNSDFHVVKASANAGTDKSHGVILNSSAFVQFDQEMLCLMGPRFAWSNGRNAPDKFTQIGMPAVVLVAGQPATLVSAEPVQYLEKLADDTLKVRGIAADSPDAPHCRFTFTVRPAEGADEGMQLACDFDVATMARRENIPGVALAVGKPVLAQFTDKLNIRVHPNEWSALLLQAPNDSNYSLLLLFKVAPAPKA